MTRSTPPSDLVTKGTWGHAAAQYCMTLAAVCNVGRVLLYHHDPSRTDTQLAAMRDDLAASNRVEVDIAREGADHRAVTTTTAQPAPRPPYDAEVADMLELTAHLPERSFAPGAVIVQEGGRSNSLWVLVSGRLTVPRDGVEINELTSPGQLIGEISLLLDIPHTATVAAVEPSVLRHADDGRELLGGDPSITLHVATGLAERLTLLTEYVADVTRQYAHVPGISMVSAVLNRMPSRGGAAAPPPSAHDGTRSPTSPTDRFRRPCVATVPRRVRSISSTPMSDVQVARWASKSISTCVGVAPIWRPGLNTQVEPMRSAQPPSGLNGG